MTLTLTALQPKKLLPRVDFDVQALREHLFENQHRAQWQQTSRCACNSQLSTTGTDVLTAFTGTPGGACDVCQGRGYIYHSSQEIPAMVTNASEIKGFYQLYGDKSRGMARLTLLPEHMPNYGDRFTLLDAIDIYTERRQRTSATVETLRYPAIIRTIPLGTVGDPTVATSTVRAVIHCTYTDVAGVAVAGELVEGTHFTINGSGQIDWTLGDGLGVSPAEGAWFALSYFMHPVYRAMEFPYINRQTYVQNKTAAPVLNMLPHRADCWLEHLGDAA